jgi:hypothetical protein
MIKMGMVGGYVATLSAERMRVLLECVEDEKCFSEPVKEFKHSRSVPLVCFIVNNQTITHIALGRRGIWAGTNLRKLSFDKIEKLPEPLAIEEIFSTVPNKNRYSIKSRFLFGGMLTEKGFNAIIEALRELAPQSSSIIERYSQTRTERIKRLSDETKQNLAYQKQAVITALSIADLKRDSLQEWTPSDKAPISFLEGLPNARLREDPMVISDFMKIPGFKVLATYPYNAAVFESDSERLTVIVANRLPLEKQTGTDLIYFNETFQSFVMVQYKAMEQEEDENGMEDAVFRLPNKNLPDEIARMDELLKILKSCDTNTETIGFRLTENPFFLKLCPRIVFNPDDISLVKGMYFPLDYWKLLENHPGIKGKRGGRSITYRNVGRYFDNTAFITVVARAWVGTTPSQSVILQSIIRQTLETGKAITIAIKPRKDEGSIVA